MKIAFLGCSDYQLPYLDAALELTNDVIVFDQRPSEGLTARSCEIHAVSYSNVDAITEILSHLGFGPSDAAFTGAAHFAWDSVARIRAHFGQAGPSAEEIDLALDKSKFYKALTEANIEVPRYQIVSPHNQPSVSHGRNYFLKSDYGKSPNYLFRIENGSFPNVPRSFDTFYRSVFLLQEEVVGTHIRLNLIRGWAQAMLKLTDSVSIPVRATDVLGSEIIAQLSSFTESIHLSDQLTKFDIILRDRQPFVIDIGLDPPNRLRAITEHRGHRFADLYLKGQIHGDWSDLVELEEDLLGSFAIALRHGAPASVLELT